MLRRVAEYMQKLVFYDRRLAFASCECVAWAEGGLCPHVFAALKVLSVPCCCTTYSLFSCTCTSISFFGLSYLSLAGGVFVVFVASLCFQSLTVIENLVYLLLKRSVLFVEALKLVFRR